MGTEADQPSVVDPHEVLRRREAFFRKVLQRAGDVTSVLAPDGRRLYISSGVRCSGTPKKRG